MRRMLLVPGLLYALATFEGGEARAQGPGGSVVYETVAPGSRSVTYGERYVVRQKPFKTVIRERPTRFVTVTPPVVRETRFYRPAPIVERELVQPPPFVETRVVQPPPVYRQRVVQPDPVVQTRYLSPYPY